MSNYTYLKSFVSAAIGMTRDPVKDAVESATEQACEYLERLEGDPESPYKVVSTNTHILNMAATSATSSR